MMPKRLNIDKIAFENLIIGSLSYSDAARKLGINPSTIIRYCKKFEINIDHFDPYKDRKSPPKLELAGQKFNRWTVIREVEKPRNKPSNSYWECQCDCGTIRVLSGNVVKTGHSKSCGCLRSEKSAENIIGFHPQQIKYTPQEATARRAFRNYDDGYLSFEEFFELSKFNCQYCNIVPSNLAKSENLSDYFIKNGNFAYSGLDRVDSSKPHCIDNIITCCMYCNKAKSALEMSQFIKHLIRMIGYRSLMWLDSYLNVIPPSIIHLPILFNRSNDYLTPFDGDIVPGIIIGKWTIIAEAGPDEGGRKRMWCRCVCGIERSVDAYSIAKGTSRSCGSPQCYQLYTPIIYKARTIWSSRYKDGDLIFEDFYTLTQMNCSYCGRPPFRTVFAKDSSLFTYNGLDRIDPSVGHFTSNVVPCCYDCNKAKNDRTLSQFDQWLTNINTHFILSGKAAEYLAKFAS